MRRHTFGVRVAQRVKNRTGPATIGGLAVAAVALTVLPGQPVDLPQASQVSSPVEASALRPAVSLPNAKMLQSTTKTPSPVMPVVAEKPSYEKMDAAQLQAEAAKMQTAFVRASLAYEAAQTEAEQATVAAETTAAKSQKAAKAAAAARDLFGAQMAAQYARGIGESPLTQVLSGDGTTIDDIYNEYMTSKMVDEAQSVTVDDMKAISNRAKSLALEAATAKTQAVEARARASKLLESIQTQASDVAEAANKALLASGDDSTLFVSAEQKARNDAALKNWRAYLASLKAARVVPPPAAQLNRKRPPRGLTTLKGTTGTPVLGVAAKRYKKKTLTVLPSETIASVSRTFALMGKPYAERTGGPTTYDCSGLNSAVWNGTKFKIGSESPVAQFRNVRLVSLKNMQVGDLVFFGDEADGIQHTGVNLGGNLMLTSDGTAQQVGVQKFPDAPMGAGRVTLPRGGANDAPKTSDDSYKRCGGQEVPAAEGGMVLPLKEGTFRYTARFGQAGSMWSSGHHTGLDFAAPVGTPVMAASGGTVTVQGNSWGGPNFVTIDHGDDLESTYAHMSSVLVKTGDTVTAGQLIGTVGALGNVTGPHLHFEVLVGGVKVDPEMFFGGGSVSTGGVAGWGGFKNGMIPSSALCPLSAGKGHALRCDAAVAWNKMATAFLKSTKKPLCITDSYRSYAVQVTTYANKPGLAAVPGTSNHGWAMAVDLCGGIEHFGSAQYNWMVTNAGKFGWVHPNWARQGGGREEPWHWEFGQLS